MPNCWGLRSGDPTAPGPKSHFSRLGRPFRLTAPSPTRASKGSAEFERRPIRSTWCCRFDNDVLMRARSKLVHRTGSLNSMTKRATKSTTIRVSKTVRDEIGALAAAENVTLDEMLRRLARAERQRRMGAELAAQAPTDNERAIITVGLATAEHHAGR